MEAPSKTASEHQCKWQPASLLVLCAIPYHPAAFDDARGTVRGGHHQPAS
jgi:hypothetical protein